MKKTILVALAATALAGCGTSHTALPVQPAGTGMTAMATKQADRMMPMIQYVTANGVMGYSFVSPPNYRIQFACYAMGDGFLNYDWHAWTPIMGFGNYADWVTPMAPGNYDVQVWVRDQNGQSTWQDVWVQVRAGAKLATTTLTAAEKASAKKAKDAKTK